jgi:hypothetical protein
MNNFTTKRPSTLAPSNKPLATVSGPVPGNLRPAPRVCDFCGADLAGRCRQARYCNPTCRARDFDRRTGRQSHAALVDGF